MVRKAVRRTAYPNAKYHLILYERVKNHEIADKLQISEGTVHTLKKFAYRKLRESLKGINYTLLLFFMTNKVNFFDYPVFFDWIVLLI